MKNSLNGTRSLYHGIILNGSYKFALNSSNFFYVIGISSIDITLYDVSNNNHRYTLHDFDKYYNYRMSDFESRYSYKPKMYFAPLSNLGEVIKNKKMSNFKT